MTAKAPTTAELRVQFSGSTSHAACVIDELAEERDALAAEVARLQMQVDRTRMILQAAAAVVNGYPTARGQIGELRHALATTPAEAAERTTAVHDFVAELAAEDCSYGDGCPPFGGTRHGTCLYCKARRALGIEP